MTQTLLETDALTVRFGGHVAVDAVSSSFRAGELTAIVGPNGAGKTTYFNLISGQIPASSGRVKLLGEDITRLGVADRCRRGLGRAFQLTNLFPSLSVLENVRLVIQSKQHKGFGLFSMADSHQELTVAAMAILERVRLDIQKGQLVSELSHGDQRKLEVALLIGLDPMVYMFDEPTAGMSVDEAPVILDLIAEIKADRARTVLLVEHKLDVIRSLADRIIVLHNGALAADGPPAEVMASAVVQEAYLGKELDHV
ncbi:MULTISPECIES: ABC transporter ATP-binding protein [Roseobacteraceae]|uniref:Branched-chain amino acid ABC transporter ATP-binding protein n=2 Tax=Celeribacter baekdonensis TaxID=875171 RepID=K2JWG7_9RHOB|nr:MULTISPECIES: ABC transporter ATP-binding protein [Roseobacteraceae]MBU0642371.1 ABC transporter ATP-binding protein [Alphaproteobacteria bacterium]EKE74629.1 branched-chain amino acid ABC transporter ATP-binding protein [Celeribacter baekdonensis B30]KAB6714687.1 ABC transporter ATP-binding protein [Roseobacter sp. TSBP12]MBU1828159.1 ABC transporter ATP-binding protein [Alphaproteobacteria bacterium]MBU2077049.1 ABC transporter ATP-binding protein [Alphaproteobacteria bacterium]|tara:strand:- start:1445 stop:2209 length:765 start_codon:yes stop_codon:yes gene_type:complete